MNAGLPHRCSVFAAPDGQLGDTARCMVCGRSPAEALRQAYLELDDVRKSLDEHRTVLDETRAEAGRHAADLHRARARVEQLERERGRFLRPEDIRANKLGDLDDRIRQLESRLRVVSELVVKLDSAACYRRELRDILEP